ncbi:MAG: Leucine--tRNA ligase [Microgenomates bacterium OLB22]|nr:MAG: Leucine--tRNA ligase [Microgenomates bacterium OLB22]
MFPYPSGAGLHVGHPRGYIATDVLSRYYRMRGYAVLHPMGWDAFGLPAENAAIKEGKNPQDLTKNYIANFKRQLRSIGFSYDWDRELATTDPAYYAISQWLFILFFYLGLLYKKNVPVYYCGYCKTGLAQEEVLSDGTHERCGNVVEQKELFQWVFKIPEYAESLLSGIDELNWPEGIKAMQRNWIGKKEGLVIHHEVEGLDYHLDTFTVYPAFSYADSYIVVASEHPVVSLILTAKQADGTDSTALRHYIDTVETLTREQKIADVKEKKGVFTGYYAIDPLTGGRLPIWVANFAMMDFGTGAIRCSAHDARDREFAKKYGIPVKSVVNDSVGAPIEASAKKGVLENSASFTGRDVSEVEQEMVEWFVSQGFAKQSTNYHLREWIFSRQRYWGEPIPMIFCDRCADLGKTAWDEDVLASTGFGLGYIDTFKRNLEQRGQSTRFITESRSMMSGWFPLTMDRLPLELPYLESYSANTEGKSPLADVFVWKKATCPCCGGPAEYETDTMPNWAGSCWYFLYFAHDSSSRGQMLPNVMRGESPFDKDLLDSWLPVDTYVGGAEHAVLHLLYSRFWIHVLNDAEIVNFREPFTSLYNQGMVLAPGGGKMSKSKGNVINPDSVIAEYGADALRLYEMFMAPFSQEVAWSTESIQGVYRFLKKVWQLCSSTDHLADGSKDEDQETFRELQKLVHKVESDMTDVKLNTIISACMEFMNVWASASSGLPRRLTKEHVSDFLKILAPFAPFITEELWSIVLGNTTSIHQSQWPVYRRSISEDKEIVLAVQVNGKLRSTIRISTSMEESDVVALAEQEKSIQKWLQGEGLSIDLCKREGAKFCNP